MVTGLSFFMKNNVHARLMEQQVQQFGAAADFCFDMIDRAVRCHFMSCENDITVKLFVRSELGMYDDFFSDMSLTVYADGREPELYSSGRISGDPQELLDGYLKVGCALRDAVLAEQLMESFGDLNLETEGILVKLIGGELRFDRVAGRKRPAMLCRTLFAGEQMVRPYSDEAYNLWGNSFVTIDSLLADANNGDEDAMERVAMAYLNGDEELQVKKDAKQAADWFMKLARQEHPSAQFELAMLYLQGKGVERNAEQALHWMERAKANGDENAFTYGESCSTIVKLENSAHEGNLQAAADLAKEYMNLGLAMDEGDGFFGLCLELANHAAEADVPEALWVLAQLYENGLGVDEDFEQALGYYRRGSELGHAACQHSLGCLYLQGDYLISDVDQGFALCMAAAEQGYAPAMQTIGRCYQFGEGVESSMKTALEWYEKYLACNLDPEFEQQLLYFKSIPGLMDDSGLTLHVDLEQVYEPEDFTMDYDFGMGFQSDSIAAMVAFGDAEAYELELLAQGVLPDAPKPESADQLTKETFPRVLLKAAEGDSRATEILATIDYAVGGSGGMGMMFGDF